jgi:hypothetical protein
MNTVFSIVTILISAVTLYYPIAFIVTSEFGSGTPGIVPRAVLCFVMMRVFIKRTYSEPVVAIEPPPSPFEIIDDNCDCDQCKFIDQMGEIEF